MAIPGADNLRFTLIVLVLTVGGPCFGQAPVDARSVQTFFDSWSTYRANYEIIYQEQARTDSLGPVVCHESGFVEVAPAAIHSFVLQVTGDLRRSAGSLECRSKRSMTIVSAHSSDLSAAGRPRTTCWDPEFLPSDATEVSVAGQSFPRTPDHGRSD